MKTLNKVLAIALAALTAASCMDKPSYNLVPFVTFPEGASKIVEEDAGKVEIPIQAFNTVNPVTVNVAVSGTAVKGVNYTITGDGNITLEPGVAKKIVVDVIDIPGVYTGDKELVLTITTTESGLEVGGASPFELTIEDKDFNYDWDWFVGKWKAVDTLNGTDYEYSVTIEKTGDNTFKLTGLADEPSDLEGVVDFVAKTAKMNMSYCGTWSGKDWDYVGITSSGNPSSVLVASFTPNAITIPFSLYSGGSWYGVNTATLSR